MYAYELGNLHNVKYFYIEIYVSFFFLIVGHPYNQRHYYGGL